MIDMIFIILAAVMLMLTGYTLITGLVTVGEFLGVVIIAIAIGGMVDAIRERREQRHEQAADAGAEKEDC